jgi:hypothetical protein
MGGQALCLATDISDDMPLAGLISVVQIVFDDIQESNCNSDKDSPIHGSNLPEKIYK